MPSIQQNTSAQADHYDPSYWERLLHGGPFYILFHLLFVVGIVASVILIVRRAPLPWMLLAACMPFVWGAAAAHLGFINLLSVLGTPASPAAIAKEFVPVMRLFDAASVASALLVAMSFLCRRKPEEKAPPS
jgi:hypothetical protein